MSASRNPRIDGIIISQTPRPASKSSTFDQDSPASTDFGFPFDGSPHGSSNSGIDAPPDLRAAHSQTFPTRGTFPDSVRYASGRIPSPQHRGSLASIDSAFDHDLFGAAALSQWTPANPLPPAAPSNAESSPRRPPSGSELDKKQPTEDQKLPAWSELKTKAGKERKRLPLACIACRRKKIRCSGEKPACKHCLRARIPCVYKVAARKAAPRTDYMAMLDKRLKRMEDRVIRVIPKDEVPDFSTTGRASVRPPLPGQVPKKDKEQPKKRSAEEAFTHELQEWRIPKEKTSVLDPTAGLRKQREGENKLFIEGSESLPPQHIQEHLAEVFFDCIYGQSYLLLHKPSFMRKLKAGTIPPVLILAVCAISARFSSHPQVSTEPAFLRGEQWATPARRIVEKRHYEPNITILTAMLMLGLHYFGTCEGGLSWSFGGQAMRMGYALQLHRELDHDPLGRNQLATNEGKKGPKPPELSFTDREIRRRTMWACYLMDTFNSSGTERPSFLNEDYYQIQLPIKESHFQMEVPGPTEDLHGNIRTDNKKSLDAASSNDTIAAEAKANMGVAAYIVRGVVLWKRIVKYLNLGGKERDPHPIWDSLSQFATLQRQIQQLKTSLPDYMTYTPENLATHSSERLANQFLFLHIVLAQASLFLHRFAIPTTPSTRPHHTAYTAAGMPKTFLSSSATTVLESAALISKLIADSTGLTLTVPFAGYCAYAAATVHVWGIFSKSASLEAASKDNLRHNYKYLTRMKRYWGMFHYMAESVKDLYRAFADAAARSQQHLAARAMAGNARRPELLRTASSSHSHSGASMLMDLDEAAGKGGAITSRSTADPDSRAVTPGGTPVVGGGAGGGGNGESGSSSKAMFQYGDWFDKYPHGVSESEWEKSHLEYRGDSGTSEAVMSQRSDLQSVEEFFATLSPPSKADDGPGGLRGKKVARRRGKSVVETPGKKAKDIKGEAASAATKDGSKEGPPTSNPGGAGATATVISPLTPTAAAGTTPHQPSQSSQGGHQVHRLSSAAPQDINLAHQFNPSDFDITSPSLYGTAQYGGPQQSQPGNDPFGYSSPNNQGFNNFAFASALPQMDRQMVFGAYAGLDPANASGQGLSLNANSPMNNFPANNPWDAIDWTGFGGYGDMNGGSVDMSSSAWLLPFNIEPPSYSEMGEYGGTALDGMDLSDLGGGGGPESDMGGGFDTGSTGR